jgi:hypothetical protein
MPPKVLSIGKDIAAVQFRDAGNEERPLLVFFELRAALRNQRAADGVVKDVRNSPAVWHAMCHGDLHLRTRRSDVIAVSPPAWKALAGYTSIVEDCRICWAAVELPARGEPLEAIFHDWNNESVLTEPLRWRLLALFRALEDLWKIMFRLVVLDPTMFVYD